MLTRGMPKRVALLFAGQGAQQVGMGKELAERHAVAANVFARADQMFGHALSQIIFSGPLEELTKTTNCQPALFVLGCALVEALREDFSEWPVVACAGLSLGEFTAHVAAGTFDFETGLQLVRERSRLMEEACLQTDGAMAALIGGEEKAVRQLAKDTGVDVANYNSPGQIVLAGATVKIEEAIRLAANYGIRRATKLNVSGAFHSTLMRPAEEALVPLLQTARLEPTAVPVVANVTARAVCTREEVCASLARQVSGSVRWTESVTFLREELGCDVFVALEPGNVVGGLVKRIVKGVEVISAGDSASLRQVTTLLRT